MRQRHAAPCRRASRCAPCKDYGAFTKHSLRCNADAGAFTKHSLICNADAGAFTKPFLGCGVDPATVTKPLSAAILKRSPADCSQLITTFRSNLPNELTDDRYTGRLEMVPCVTPPHGSCCQLASCGLRAAASEASAKLPLVCSAYTVQFTTGPAR